MTVFAHLFSKIKYAMKKHSLLITIITVIFLVFAGFWAYNYYLKPIYLNNSTQTKKILLSSKSKTITFIKHRGQKSVFGIEIEMKGSASKNVSFVLSNNQSVILSGSLKKGEIKYNHHSDWYSDTCQISFDIVPDTKGEIDVDCRFLTLN